MPITVTCAVCGRTLAKYKKLPGAFWYEDLLAKLSGKCPKCSHPFPRPPLLNKMQFKAKHNPATTHPHRVLIGFRQGYQKRGMQP